MASTIRRVASATAVLVILAVPTGFAGGGSARGDTDLTLTSPAFADGAPLPLHNACTRLGGVNTPPPLAWSAPPDAGGLALVMDDPDAVGGLFVHWIVIGIPPGPGSTADGQTPNGLVEPNDNGQLGYLGPCPPAGSGTHNYQFKLYSVPDLADLTPRLGAGGTQAAQAIAQASTAGVTLTGTWSSG
jgi:Raf kinase inhibitor-like YbhB/YbcL family protein